ncbi:hypothetical protein ABPG74_015382 [Tetrahymena malaccensis]
MKRQIPLILIITFSLIQCSSDFTSQNYQSMTRSQKQTLIWEELIKDKTSADAPFAGGVLVESMDPTIQRVSDILPEGRSKVLHPIGTVCKAEFIPTPNSPYSGFFQGADSLIIRFSVAKEPHYTKKQAKYAYDNFVPGFALKFLIDGQPSANLFAIYGMNGVDSYNFFDKDFSTHIPIPKSLETTVVADKQSSGTKIVSFVGLRKLSEHTQDGIPVSGSKFPYSLTFKAKQDVKNKFTQDFTQDFRKTFQTFQPGTTIFEVYATDNPIQACQKKIGEIRTTSEITPSYFGDTSLFFQHQDFSLDLEVHPEWEPYTPYWRIFGNKNPSKQEGKCPFSQLF